MNPTISTLDIINTSMSGLLLIMVLTLLLRLHITGTMRDEMHHFRDELDAIKLRLSVHEQSSPCEHCQNHHGAHHHDET